MAAVFDTIVIGGGANGLVAAAAAARAGQRVLLLEERDVLGGQGRTIEFAPGFRAAPLQHGGWVTPHVARALDLKLERVEPDAPLSVPVDGDEWLSVWRDVPRAAAALRRFSGRDAEQWPAFARRLHSLSGFLAHLYQQPAPDLDSTAPRDVLAMLGVGRRLRALGRADLTEFLRLMPMAVEELVEDWFECMPLRAGIAAGGVQQLAQGPRSGGTTFVLLHHLIGAPHGAVRSAGWWRAAPDAFIAAAEAAVRRSSVTVRTGAAVARIQVRDDAVAGVVLASGEEIAARRVLSTADPVRTLLGLVDPVWLDPEFLLAVRNIRLRGATAVVCYALDGLPPLAGGDTMLQGVVSLSQTVTMLNQAADAAKYGAISEQPHVELTVPTLRWSHGLAPAGRHVLVATAQWAPYHLRDGAWDDARRDVLEQRVTAAIEAVAPGFTSRVLHRSTLAPPDIEQQYGLTQGALTHGELMLDQILFMRPVPGWGRYATPIAGLYMGGAGTHPGPAIPGAAGALAAARLARDN
ncbi:MAG TPA: NAD(P)/FAD-dependent oxidoreductase [Longimicrobiales bacterium]|nr:NAD(P)/FAD-dependent oxidoreductase [Longimicrobiales bacterium]